MLSKKEIMTLPEGKHLIEPNLYLRVRGNYRVYYFLYSFAGTRKEIALGSVSKVTLTMARQQASKCKVLLSQGIDPQLARKTHRIRVKEELETINKNETTLRAFYDKILPDILNAKQLHGDNSKRKYTHMPYTYIMPVLGDMPLSDIKTEDIVRCLKPLWKRVPPSALKMRLVLELVFGYAKQQGYYTGDNPATYKFNLDMYLPPYGKIHETKHRRHASNDDLRHLLKLMAVWHWWFPKSLQPLMIMLTALLACRSVECCDLSWSEIDLENRIITLPNPNFERDFQKASFNCPND